MENNYKGILAKYRILDFAEILVGGISIISSIISIWVFFQDQTSKLPFYAFSLIIAFAVVLFIKVLKLQAVALNRLNVFTETYHKFSHLIRDEYYKLKRLHDEKKLDYDPLLASTANTAQKCVDWIADALIKSTGENVSVYLKYFPENLSRSPHSVSSISDLYVKTLAKSFNSPINVDLDILEKVGDSTPLFFLMKERSSDFRAENVNLINKELKLMGLDYYRDARPKWQDHYKSIIVVPIRIKINLIDSSGSAGSGFDILGFLWAESLSTSAFPYDHIDAYCNLLKGFADILYSYLDRLDNYFDEIFKSKGS